MRIAHPRSPFLLAQTVSVSDTLTLTATATDDGRPKPIPDPEGRLQQGVRVRWIVYRGTGKVRSTPDIMPGRVYGKPATLASRVNFSSLLARTGCAPSPVMARRFQPTT